MGDKEVNELDKTFQIVLIVVTVSLFAALNAQIYGSQPFAHVGFLIGYFFVPFISTVLLWWIAVFFDYSNLRIVGWYGLFYFVVYSLWILLDVAGLKGDTVAGLSVLSPFIFSAIPTFFIFKRYKQFRVLSASRVVYGCGSFFVFVFLLAVFSTQF